MHQQRPPANTHPPNYGLSAGFIPNNGFAFPQFGYPTGNQVFSSESPQHGPSANESPHIDNIPTSKPSVRTPAPTTINIENACLAFLHSEMLRKDQHDVINSVSKNFGIDELLAAREVLYRSTGTKKYQYRGPNEPSNPDQKCSYCVASMLAKMQEIENGSLQIVRYLCPSFDIFRLLNTVPTNVSSIESRLTALEQDKHKLIELESEIKKLKTANTAPAPTFAGIASSYPTLSRQNLINDVQNQQRQHTPKRLRSDDGEWNGVAYKKNGVRPKRNKPSFWGKQSGSTEQSGSLLGAPEVFEIFLSNYRKTASEEDVKAHFLNHKVSVINVRLRSREESYNKSFMMKIPIKDDFQKVIDVLPYRTGARWYERVPPYGNRDIGNATTGSNTPRATHYSVPHSQPADKELSTPPRPVPLPAFRNMETPTASSNTASEASVPAPTTTSAPSFSGGGTFTVDSMITPIAAANTPASVPRSDPVQPPTTTS